MCEHGDTTMVRVVVPARLSHSGEEYVKEAQVDSCLAPLIREMQAAGIRTTGCCCGHGRGPGDILFEDDEGNRHMIKLPAAKPSRPHVGQETADA